MKLFRPDAATPVAPIAAHAAYSAATAKRSALREDMRGLEAELREVGRKLAERFAEQTDAETDRVAKALLSGDAEEATAETTAALTARARDLEVLIAAHRRADNLLRIEVEGIRGDLSIDAAASAAPQHREAVGALVVALDSLRVAIANEASARRILTDAGYDDRLPSHAPPIRVDAGPENYELSRWEHAARAYAA